MVLFILNKAVKVIGAIVGSAVYYVSDTMLLQYLLVLRNKIATQIEKIVNDL
jgi:hypothetical protein